MFIKDLNLYINEKNIVTIMPYFLKNGAYGLKINGACYELGCFYSFSPTIEERTAVLGKMKALQTQIIKKIEK